MMTIIKKISFILLALLMVACSGEDRTYEYEKLTTHNHWIYDQMKDAYLWADSLKSEPEWRKFFGDPYSFLPTVTSKGIGDKWSYIEVDTIKTKDPHQRGNFNHYDSYGFDFVQMTDPTGQTNKLYVRVVTVYPESPADRCGLQRGDFIVSYDGYKLSANNISKLQKGIARKLTVCHLDVNIDEQAFFWRDTVTLQIAESEYVEDKAFPLKPVIFNNEEGKGSVAYLMCNRLTVGAAEQQGREMDMRYLQQMDELMAMVKSSGAEGMILDLRLCNDGTMEMARRLASYIVSPAYLGSPLFMTTWNRNHSANNAVIPFDASVSNLGLKRICFLTSSYTQGAAEWMIHSLRNIMGEENVILIGEKTAGQNVMTLSVGHDYMVNLCPVVAFVADGTGNMDYASGIRPDVEIKELSNLELYNYADSRELLLNTALLNMFAF